MYVCVPADEVFPFLSDDTVLIVFVFQSCLFADHKRNSHPPTHTTLAKWHKVVVDGEEAEIVREWMELSHKLVNGISRKATTITSTTKLLAYNSVVCVMWDQVSILDLT